MPTKTPKLPVPNTASLNEAGFPVCIKCDRRLRGQFGGYGYHGNGHFCTVRCAAEWAEIKVESVT